LNFTRQVAIDYAAHGITVNAVGPGFIYTPMTDVYCQGFRDILAAQSPNGKWGTPQQVADAVLFQTFWSTAAGPWAFMPISELVAKEMIGAQQHSTFTILVGRNSCERSGIKHGSSSSNPGDQLAYRMPIVVRA
jgi:hypothetical protein